MLLSCVAPLSAANDANDNRLVKPEQFQLVACLNRACLRQTAQLPSPGIEFGLLIAVQPSRRGETAGCGFRRSGLRSCSPDVDELQHRPPSAVALFDRGNELEWELCQAAAADN